MECIRCLFGLQNIFTNFSRYIDAIHKSQNHKITKSQITKGFCDNHQKSYIIYYSYFITSICIFPFLFFHFIFPFVICDFVILWFCDFVILWQCTMKSTRVKSTVRTIGKAHGSRVLCVFGMTAAMTQVLSCANLGSSMWGNSIMAYSDLP